LKTRRSTWIIRKMRLWGIDCESVNWTNVAQNGIKMQGSGVQNSGSNMSKSAFCQKTTRQTYLYNKHQSLLNYVGSQSPVFKPHRMKPPTASVSKESSSCTFLLHNKPTWRRTVRQDGCLSVKLHLHLGEPT